MGAPTGEQFSLELKNGSTGTRAIVTEVAAALRVLEVDGVELIDPYPAESTPPYASGIVLAPWPNRIRDGVWFLDGEPQQLDITEVEKNNAIHGLLRTMPYRVSDKQDSTVTLDATIYPQHGYPFILETSVRYELVPDGLVVTHRFVNLSDAAAPVAVGTHPFVKVGDTPISELILTVDAGTRFVVDDRLNPVDEVSVDGTDFDLRHGRRVGELELDTAFGGVRHGPDGLARHRVTAPGGQFTELWQGPDFGYVQAFTPRSFPRPRSGAPDALGQAVAIEPMTAPPDAFNSGKGLRWLQPGESWSGSWGMNYGRE
jgi:aldose 1-epimerase